VLEAIRRPRLDKRSRNGVDRNANGTACATTIQLAGVAELIDFLRTEPKPFSGFGDCQIFIRVHAVLSNLEVFLQVLSQKERHETAFTKGSPPKSGPRPW
jgi:hypothetical protein